MRSRCGTPRHGSRRMELERPCRLKEEPQLSGAYIRSLVKHLSTSMPKGARNPKPQDGASGVEERPDDLPNLGEAQQEQQQDQKATPLRKPTRRRVCTSKPYQERLINMAEARREIVSALKFHRAAMKRASEQQQQREDQQIKSLQQEKPSQQVPPPPPPSSEEPQRKTTGRENPSLYPSCSDNLDMLFSYFNNPSLPSSSNYPPNSSWPYDNSLAPLPISGNPINLTLPSRPLGLNLNLQDFNSIDINLIYTSSSDPPMLSSTSSTFSPSYSHPAISPMTSMPAPAIPSASSAVLPLQTIEAMPNPAAAGGMLHPAMGDEEIAEIRSIGEQHDMEWNDKLSLVTSVWWCNLLQTMEVSSQAQLQEASRHGISEGMARNGGLGSFDEVIDVPSWLSDQQQAADDYSQYLQDASLPW